MSQAQWSDPLKASRCRLDTGQAQHLLRTKAAPLRAGGLRRSTHPPTLYSPSHALLTPGPDSLAFQVLTIPRTSDTSPSGRPTPDIPTTRPYLIVGVGGWL